MLNIINYIDFKQLHNVIIGMLTILIPLFIFIFGQYNSNSEKDIAFREIIIDSIRWKALIIYIPISLFLLSLNVPFLVIKIIILSIFIFSIRILYGMLSFLFHLVLGARFQLSKKLLKGGASLDKKIQFWKYAVWAKQWSLEEEKEFKELFLEQFKRQLNLIVKDKLDTRNQNNQNNENTINIKKLLESFYYNLNTSNKKNKSHQLQAEDIFLETISTIDDYDNKMDYLQSIFKLSFNNMLNSFKIEFEETKEVTFSEEIKNFIIDVVVKNKYKKSENFMVKKILEILEENNKLSDLKEIIIDFIENELWFENFPKEEQKKFIKNLETLIDKVINT